MTAADTLERETLAITLAEACGLLGNRVKVATLRAEAARGNLTIFRLGRRDFTTAKDVREMVRRCRDADPRRACTSTLSASSGLSETEKASSAQAALSQTVQALRSSSVVTLYKNTNRRAGPTR